ncbi:camelysin. Metallo peptidase. MEROPS family M73 [Alteribacillus persepolensis]|uniref:Camelysin. Metallo peptidase. MEROPS family M73 n=1 Tax=Alteribacillus persepolensis TaxID=568899 RepID=A0A1G8JRA6_9BACI|nr:TasA family protein [Alteribacillus persepolensis]SDI33726.1 camelysin. Metallo peptidase. MEROPS family M73 [Alteribacillus persepolensis]
MKKTKKALIATTLAGAVAVGAGFGTFSWFTDSQSTDGEITAGTLTLNDLSEYTVFSEGNMQPIDPEITPDLITEGENITVENTGSLEMVPRLQLDVEIKDDKGNDASETLSDEYMIKMTFDRNDMNWSEEISADKVIDNRGFVDPDWFPSDAGFKYPLGPDESFDVQFDVYLNKDAGNEYQGSSLTGTLNVEGGQSVDGAEFEDGTETDGSEG